MSREIINREILGLEFIRKDLVDTLERVEHFVPNARSRKMYVQSTENSLLLVAENDEYIVKENCEYKLEDEIGNGLCISVNSFKEIIGTIKQFKEDKIFLNLKETNENYTILEIRNKSGSRTVCYEYLTSTYEQEIQNYNEKGFIEIPYSVILELEKILFTSNDKSYSNTVFMNVLFDIQKDKVSFVYSDAKKLTYLEKNIEMNGIHLVGLEGTTLLVPSYLVKKLISIKSIGKESKVVFTLFESKVVLKVEKTSIVFDFDAKVPYNYRSVIPDSNDYVEFSRKELIESLKFIKNVINNEKNTGIPTSITHKDGKIILSAKSDKKSVSTSIVPLVVNENINLYLDCQKLMDLLSIIEFDTIRIYFKNNDYPITLKSKESDEYFALLMTMKKESD